MASNYAFQILVAEFLFFFYPEVLNYSIAGNILNTFSLLCVSLPLYLLVLSRLPKVKPLKSKAGAGYFFGGICISITLLVAGNFVGSYLLSIFEQLTGKVLTNPLEESLAQATTLENFIFVVIAAPLVEELIFRKVTCDRLLPLGEGYAVVVSSAVFALVHGNLFQCFYAFTIGILLSFFYVKTGKLRYSVIYHMIINFMGSIIAPALLERIDLDALVEGNMEVLMADPLPVVIYYFYLLIYYAALILGIVFMVLWRKQFKLNAGILPVSKNSRVSCFFGNVGVAVAMVVFSAVMVLSLVRV